MYLQKYTYTQLRHAEFDLRGEDELWGHSSSQHYTTLLEPFNNSCAIQLCQYTDWYTNTAYSIYTEHILHVHSIYTQCSSQNYSTLPGPFNHSCVIQLCQYTGECRNKIYSMYTLLILNVYKHSIYTQCIRQHSTTLLEPFCNSIQSTGKYNQRASSTLSVL